MPAGSSSRPSHSPLPLKRRRDSDRSPHSGVPSMNQYTLGGHLDDPNDLRCILGNMLSDPALGSLCDVVIVVQGQRFPAHKAVLAAASDVFKAMFTNQMRERRQSEVVLEELEAQTWKMAMRYIYHAQLDIDDEKTALSLLATARMYQLQRLETFVEKFLVSCVRTSNCFQLLVEGDRFALDQLTEACYRRMATEFEAIALSPAFLKCPFSVVEKLVSSGALVLKSEACVLDAILRWVKADKSERLKALDKLLKLVRLNSMSVLELRRAAREGLLRESRSFLQEVYDRVLSAGEDASDELMSSGCHLKARKRDGRVFTFYHLQRGMTKVSPADEEEVVRTPWAWDDATGYLWRLKIYPRGYSKAKGHYLSMYVQGRSGSKGKKLDVCAKFDIFLMNRKDGMQSVSFSSEHRFREESDHWGFHRFLELPQLLNPGNGFLDEDSDSVIVGGNLYFE